MEEPSGSPLSESLPTPAAPTADPGAVGSSPFIVEPPINDFTGSANKAPNLSAPAGTSPISQAAGKSPLTAGGDLNPAAGYAKSAQKVADKFGQAKAEGQGNIQAGAQAAVQAAKEVAKQVARKAIQATGVGAVALYIAEHKWARNLVLVLLLMIVGMGGSAFAFVIGSLSGTKLEGSALTIPAAGDAVSGSYCSNMQSTLDFKDYKGKQVHLTLPSREGGFSNEDPINPTTGRVYLDGKTSNPGGKLSMWDYRNHDSLTGQALPSSYYPFYVTGRWSYVATNWHGHSTSAQKQFRDVPDVTDFVGRRIIIYNPATKKAVLGVIMEFGPSPAAHPELAIASATKAGKTPVLSVDQDEQAWNATNGGYQIANPASPAGFTDLDVGGPQLPDDGSVSQTTASAIGATEGTYVTYGFAPTELQNHAPGPIDCQVVTPTLSSSGSGATSDGGYQMDVPLEDQAPNQCNRYSDLMAAEYIAIQEGSDYSGFKRLINSACGISTLGLFQSYMKTAKPPLPYTVTREAVTLTDDVNDAGHQKIYGLLSKGIPVVIHTHLFGYDTHWVTLTGYSGDKQYFYFNDPERGDTRKEGGNRKNAKLPASNSGYWMNNADGKGNIVYATKNGS